MKKLDPKEEEDDRSNLARCSDVICHSDGLLLRAVVVLQGGQGEMKERPFLSAPINSPRRGQR